MRLVGVYGLREVPAELRLGPWVQLLLRMPVRHELDMGRLRFTMLQLVSELGVRMLRAFRRSIRPLIIALLRAMPSPEKCGCAARKDWMIKQIEAI